MSNPVETIDIDLKLLVTNVDTADIEKQVQKATDSLARRRKNSKVSLGTVDTKEAVDSVRVAIDSLEAKVASLDKKTDSTLVNMLNKRKAAFQQLNRELEKVIRAEVRAQDAVKPPKEPKKESPKPVKEPKPPKQPEIKSQELSDLAKKRFELSQDPNTSTDARKKRGVTAYINELEKLISVNRAVVESDKAVEAEKLKALTITAQYEAELRKLNKEVEKAAVKPVKEPKDPYGKAQEISDLSKKRFELSQDLSRSTPGQKTTGLTTYINELNRLIAVNDTVAHSEKTVEAERLKAIAVMGQYEAEVRKLNLELGRHTGNTNQTLTQVQINKRALDKSQAMLKEAQVQREIALRSVGQNVSFSGDNNQLVKAYNEAIAAGLKVLKIQQAITDLTGKNAVDHRIEHENTKIQQRIKALETTKKILDDEEKADKKLQGITRALKALPTSSLDDSARLKAVKSLSAELDKMFVDIAKGQLIPPQALITLQQAAKEAKNLAAALEQASHVPEIAKASQGLAARKDALDKFRGIRETGRYEETANERSKYDLQELKLLRELEHAQKVLLKSEEDRYAKEKQLHDQNRAAGVVGPAPTTVNTKAHLDGIHATRAEINKLTQELKGFDILMAKITQGVGLFFRYAVVYKVLGQFTQFIGGATTEMVALDKALVNIKAVANATNAEIDTVSASILRIGENSHFTAQEVAGAAETLVQAGVKIGSLDSVLQSTTDLAAAAGAGVQQAAELVTTFLAVYREASPDQIADSLKAAVNISKLSIGDLSTISNYLLSTGRAFNEDYKDTLAISATLRNAGIKASTIATGSRQALTELLSPDPKALAGLKARYTKLGQDLSTDSIKALFKGFRNSRDPMAAALAELQKLGLDKLGDNELGRIFDTRSTNIIRTLTQQQDELKANRIAIDDAGSAAAGAKTQLQSLSASASNLREVIVGGAFKTSESFIGALAKDLTKLTHNIDTVIKRLRDVKAETGSTGVLPALSTAAGAAAGALLKGKSVGTSAVVGAVAGGASIAGRTADTETSSGRTAETIGKVTESVVAISLFSGIFSKLAQPLAKAAGAFSKLAGVVGGAITALRTGVSVAGVAGSALAFLGSSAAFIPAMLATAGVLFYKLYQRVAGTNEDIAKISAAQSAAINERIAERRKIIDDLKKKIEVSKEKQDTTVKFAKAFTDLDEAIANVTEGKLNSQIKSLIEASGNISKQIGSASLEDLAKQVETITQRPVDRRALSSALQQRDAALAVSEATRSQISREVQLAQDHVSDGTASEREQNLIKAFAELDAKQALLLTSTITTTEQAKSLLNLKKHLESTVKDLTGIYSDEEKIAEETAGIAKDVVEETANLMRRVTGKDRADSSKAKAELQSKILGFVAAGEVTLVEAMLFQAQGALDASLLDAAKANKKAIAVAPLNKLIQDTRDKQKAEGEAPADLKDYVKRPVSKQESRTEKAIVEKELDIQRRELIRMTAYEIEQVNAGRTAESLKAVTEERLTLQEKIKDNEQRLSTFIAQDVDSAETHKELVRSMFLTEQRLKEATQKYADLQETQLSSVSEQIAAVKEITSIKLKQLKIEKTMLAEQLRLELSQENNIDASGKTPEEMLKLLSTAKGQELVVKSAGIGDKYKALLDVVGKEVDTRREIVKDLNNIKVASDKRKIKSLEEKLPEADKRVKDAEARLNTATNNLASARQNLANAVAEQDNITAFFDSALADVGGGDTSASRSDLLSRLLTPTAEEAKAIASDAQASFRAGKLSKGDAKSIIEEAKTKAQNYQASVIEQNTAALIRAQNIQNFQAEETSKAVSAQRELNQSIIYLTTVMETLGDAQSRAVGLLEANSVDPSAFGLQSSNPNAVDRRLNKNFELVDLGALPTAKTNETQPVIFNFGGASVKAMAEQKAVGQFTDQLRMEEAKLKW